MSDIRADTTRAEASRRGDPFLPVYAAESGDTKGTFPVSIDQQEQLDGACERARELFPLQHPGQAMADIAAALCAALPRLGIVHTEGEEKHTEFHWARTRCLFAGFGWHLHAEIAAACCDLFSVCDLDPDEDQETWQRKLTDAHRMCGWPSCLVLLQWRAIANLGETGDNPAPEPWQQCVALAHILKHLRASSVHGLVVTYRGTANSVQADDRASSLAGNKGIREQIVKLLCCSRSAGKDKHTMTLAVETQLGALTRSTLLQREPPAKLPGTVIAGPWATLTPDPDAMTGHIQHGMRLTGVWFATQGKVRPTQGDTDDIMGYDWGINYNATQEEKTLFESTIPSTYDTEHYPNNVLFRAFPNILTSGYGNDPRLFQTLFDAAMCASLLGGDIPDLVAEKLFIACMPNKPSLDKSTNQGKTACSWMIARAISPGIPCEYTKSTNDAPGRRSLAASMQRYGTLCAEEWKPPRNEDHLLSHQALQSLLTGGSVTYGVVHGNASIKLALRFHIVADAKALDVPPDMNNRLFCIWLRTLTNAERANGDIVSDVKSGRMSIRLRLAALATCERHNLAERAEAAPRATTENGWRHPVLRAIARIIWTDRYTAAEVDRLDDAIADMQQTQRRHTTEADENGVLAMLEAGTGLSVRVHALFDGLTMTEMESCAALAQTRNEDQGNLHGCSMSAILRARADATGFLNRPLSMMAESVIGARSRGSDRVFAIALARDIRTVLPTVGSVWALPDHLGIAGWRLARRADVNDSPRIDILRPGEKPAAAT